MRDIIRDSGRPEPVLRQNCVDGLEYLTFPALDETNIVKHLFSTRVGGVSKGIYSSLNVSFQRGDAPEDVAENYRRIGRVLHIAPERMVASRQTHTTNIRRVTEEDCGKGITCQQDYSDVDGLVTNIPGICLVTHYADCVPLFFVDPVHEAIGLAHSGWRGTAAKMGACMVRRMRDEFGSRAEDLVTAIGPCICRDCYEVSEDVASVFLGLYPDTEIVSAGKQPGKYQLDLRLANRSVLLEAGISEEHISVTDICTCHNPEYLFSHRASHGQRGNLGAFLALK